MSTPPASVTLRRGLSGLFLDFVLLPELLALAVAGDGAREQVTVDWSERFQRSGFSHEYIDEDDVTGSEADAVAADAWRFAERMGLIDSEGMTAEGARLVALTESRGPGEVRRALVGILRRAVTRHLRGPGSLEVLPLLGAGARTLMSTTNLWARECPGLIPVEVSSLIHWAHVDATRAQKLLSSLVTWRDVAMHRYEAPDAEAEEGFNASLHFDTVSAFYLSHPWLAERTPMSFSEELATCRLLSYCGLLRLVEAANTSAYCLVETRPSEDDQAC